MVCALGDIACRMPWHVMSPRYPMKPRANCIWVMGVLLMNQWWRLGSMQLGLMPRANFPSSSSHEIVGYHVEK